tara:strand:- start:830 stop:940 length:111 start_codon:yes stop_codon:yes gene_type:complete
MNEAQFLKRVADSMGRGLVFFNIAITQRKNSEYGKR